MTTSITIHGHVFPLLVDDTGAEVVTLAMLCSPFELKVDGQRERLSKTPWGTLQKIWSVRSNGKRAAFWCLPLRRVPMFFATLSLGHVAEEYRSALEAFQCESADVVGDYYLHGGTFRRNAPPDQLRRLVEQLDEFLRSKPLTDYIWPQPFVKRYESWHGRTWKAGDPQPFSMQSANWFFYTMIFPPEILAIVRDRGLLEGCRYHQILADAPRDYLQRELRLATVLAEECGSEIEWRARMRRAYGKTKAELGGQRSLGL